VTARAGRTRLRWGGATDVGRVRSNNQDQFVARDDVGLWAVADGMGGHRGGEVASEIACETVARSFDRHTIEGLVDAIEQANSAVYRAGTGDPDLTGMGTTIVVLALVEHDDDELLAIANVGDSRGYRWSDGELDQLTTDHSLVADLVREGSLSPDEAAVHPQRNILTRVLGVYDDVPVDAFAVEPRHGDRYLLCSDGLFNEVPEDTIASVLRRRKDPSAAADELVRLAREGGGRDNITVVVVDVIDDGGRAEAASAALAAQDGEATHAAPAAPGAAYEDAGDGAPTRTARHRRVDTPPPEDAERRPGARHARRSRRFTWRVALFVVLIVAVVGGALATIQWYGRSTYFVGLEGDQVAIYKGRPGGLLWIEPSLVEPTDLEARRLPASRRTEVENGKEVATLAAARNYIENLSEQADELDPPVTTTATTTTLPTTTTTLPLATPAAPGPA
jgi:serine/threonine protein phosphatase PrpC